MLNRHLLFSIAVAQVFLGSCSSGIRMTQIEFVELGMSARDLFSITDQDPCQVFTIVDPQEKLEYEVRIFLMVTGAESSPSGLWTQGMYIPITYTFPVHETFAFLFFQDSLLFWGFLHEFARSDDQRIRRLPPIIIQEAQRETQRESAE